MATRTLYEIPGVTMADLLDGETGDLDQETALVADKKAAEKIAKRVHHDRAVRWARERQAARDGRRNLQKDGGLKVAGATLRPEDVFPDPPPLEPVEPVPVKVRDVYDVVSGRDGERVVIGVDRRTSEKERDRLNAEVLGEKPRFAHVGSNDASNPDTPQRIELPPHPTALVRKYTMPGPNGPVEQDQHLDLRPATEYFVQPRVERVTDEEEAAA